MKVTPEERVRQDVIAWLIRDQRWPLRLLGTEDDLRRHGRGSGRADVVLYGQHSVAGNRKDPPVFGIVECKREEVCLTDATSTQAERYARRLGATLFATTNGLELQVRQKRERRGPTRYTLRAKFPSYREAVRGKALDEVQPARPFRPSWDTLLNPTKLRRLVKGRGSEFLGNDTPVWFWRPLLDLATLLVSPRHIEGLPWSGYGVTIVRDHGPYSRSLGNASGGAFRGVYRTFSVRTANGENVALYFSVMGAEYTRVQPTVIIVAVDDGHNPCVSPSLQFQVDRGFHGKENRITLEHDGVMTWQGGVPRRVVIKAARNADPTLVQGGHVNLGSLPYERQLTFPIIKDVLLRFSAYAIVRKKIRYPS